MQNFAAGDELGLENPDHSKKRVQNFAAEEELGFEYHEHSMKRGKNFPQKRNCRIMSTARNECKVLPLQKNQGLENHEHSTKNCGKREIRVWRIMSTVRNERRICRIGETRVWRIPSIAGTERNIAAEEELGIGGSRAQHETSAKVLRLTRN